MKKLIFLLRKKQDILDDIISGNQGLWNLVKDQVTQIGNVGKESLRFQVENSKEILQKQNEEIANMFGSFYKK